MVIIVGYLKDGFPKERVISAPMVTAITKKAKKAAMYEIAEKYVSRSSISYVLEVTAEQMEGDGYAAEF
jgi:hypothetical protein